MTALELGQRLRDEFPGVNPSIEMTVWPEGPPGKETNVHYTAHWRGRCELLLRSLDAVFVWFRAQAEIDSKDVNAQQLEIGEEVQL